MPMQAPLPALASIGRPGSLLAAPAAEGSAREDLRSTRIMALLNMYPCSKCLRNDSSGSLGN